VSGSKVTGSGTVAVVASLAALLRLPRPRFGEARFGKDGTFGPLDFVMEKGRREMRPTRNIKVTQRKRQPYSAHHQLDRLEGLGMVHDAYRHCAFHKDDHQVQHGTVQRAPLRQNVHKRRVMQ
jgi:hypothetical protein